MKAGVPTSVLRRLAGALGKSEAGRNEDFWQPVGRDYPRLQSFDRAGEGLAGKSGLYLLWHLGVRPRWIKVGATRDLDGAVALLAQTPEILAFIDHDGPFLSWVFCEPDEAANLVAGLIERLRPVAQDMISACDLPLQTTSARPVCPLPRGTKEIP